MKVKISLNLPSIFLNAGFGRLPGFVDDPLKLGAIVSGKTPEAQLNGKQVKGIHECKNLGAIGIGPAAHIHTARRPTLNHPNLLQALKSIPNRRPAHLETLSQILFAEPLVRNKLAFSNGVQNLEDNPVSQRAIDRLRGKARCFVQQIQKHISRQYTIRAFAI